MMLCPYCEVEILIRDVDAEDGYCPECGAVITPASIFQEDEELSDMDILDEEDDF